MQHLSVDEGGNDVLREYVDEYLSNDFVSPGTKSLASVTCTPSPGRTIGYDDSDRNGDSRSKQIQCRVFSPIVPSFSLVHGRRAANQRNEHKRDHQGFQTANKRFAEKLKKPFMM